MRDVVQALVDQQSAGYIHGEIRTNNVMVVRKESSGQYDWDSEYSGKLVDLHLSGQIGWCQ